MASFSCWLGQTALSAVGPGTAAEPKKTKASEITEGRRGGSRGPLGLPASLVLDPCCPLGIFLWTWLFCHCLFHYGNFFLHQNLPIPRGTLKLIALAVQEEEVAGHRLNR